MEIFAIPLKKKKAFMALDRTMKNGGWKASRCGHEEGPSSSWNIYNNTAVIREALAKLESDGMKWLSSR